MKVFENGVKIKVRWVGDFQEGFARVRRKDGLYNHINHRGEVLSKTWWKDVWGFYEGFARVQREDGTWTNIDTTGNERVENKEEK